MKDMHDMLAEVKETDMSEEVAAETIKVWRIFTLHRIYTGHDLATHR